MDFEAFLKDVLTPLLDHPEALQVRVEGEGRRREVWIHAEPGDRGRIIGKSGRMISSLRTLCRTAGDKDGVQVEVEVFDEDERAPRQGADRGREG